MEANFGDRAFDAGSNKVWDGVNSGVCSRRAVSEAEKETNIAQRQWKDIKAKYVQVAEDEE